jgi:hypothetical protein
MSPNCPPRLASSWASVVLANHRLKRARKLPANLFAFVRPKEIENACDRLSGIGRVQG